MMASCGATSPATGDTGGEGTNEALSREVGFGLRQRRQRGRFGEVLSLPEENLAMKLNAMRPGLRTVPTARLE